MAQTHSLHLVYNSMFIFIQKPLLKGVCVCVLNCFDVNNLAYSLFVVQGALHMPVSHTLHIPQPDMSLTGSI